MLIVNYYHPLTLLLIASLIFVLRNLLTFLTPFLLMGRVIINYHTILNEKIELKDGFNASLQHAFFDWGREFYFHKIHLICPAKFDRHPKRKINFSSLFTTATPSRHLRTSRIKLKSRIISKSCYFRYDVRFFTQN